MCTSCRVHRRQRLHLSACMLLVKHWFIIRSQHQNSRLSNFGTLAGFKESQFDVLDRWKIALIDSVNRNVVDRLLCRRYWLQGNQKQRNHCSPRARWSRSDSLLITWLCGQFSAVPRLFYILNVVKAWDHKNCGISCSKRIKEVAFKCAKVYRTIPHDLNLFILRNAKID